MSLHSWYVFVVLVVFCIFFFKQKTAYELRISDWSSDVCSSDLARPEADGTITLLGRGSSCINTGGEKVHPDEVAAAVKTHPDVADAIVVGAPDERFGQRVVAGVAPRQGAMPDLDSVRKHLKPHLAGYKAPPPPVQAAQLRYTPQGQPDLR